MVATLLQHYWEGPALAANLLIGANLVGALLLGMLVGYERSYNGRAAGMRTYGLVSMAAAGLTLCTGVSQVWFGGAGLPGATDPTRTVQGIVTGVGFLCAGVIVKDGLTIRGLTTAASIWTVAATGVLLGLGLYGAAILLALLSTASMAVLHRLEGKLPGRSTAEVTVTFATAVQPSMEEVSARAETGGYVVIRDSLSVAFADHRQVWKFVVVALERSRAKSLALLSEELAQAPGVDRFNITPVRT